MESPLKADTIFDKSTRGQNAMSNAHLVPKKIIKLKKIQSPCSFSQNSMIQDEQPGTQSVNNGKDNTNNHMKIIKTVNTIE